MSDRRSNFGFSRVKKIKHSRATVHFFEEESIQKNKFKPAFIIFMSLSKELENTSSKPYISTALKDKMLHIQSKQLTIQNKIATVQNIGNLKLPIRRNCGIDLGRQREYTENPYKRVGLDFNFRNQNSIKDEI